MPDPLEAPSAGKFVSALFAAVATGPAPKPSEQMAPPASLEATRTYWFLAATWGRWEGLYVPIVGLVPLRDAVLRRVEAPGDGPEQATGQTVLSLDTPRILQKMVPPGGRRLDDYVVPGHLAAELRLDWSEICKTTARLWAEAEAELAQVKGDADATKKVVMRYARYRPWLLLTDPLWTAAADVLGMPEDLPLAVTQQAIAQEKASRGRGRPPTQVPYRPDLEIMRHWKGLGHPYARMEDYLGQLPGLITDPTSRSRETTAKNIPEYWRRRGVVPHCVPLLELWVNGWDDTVEDEGDAMLQLVRQDVFKPFLDIVACGDGERIRTLETTGTFYR